MSEENIRLDNDQSVDDQSMKTAPLIPPVNGKPGKRAKPGMPGMPGGPGKPGKPGKGGMPGGMAPRRPKNAKKTIGRLFKYVMAYRVQLVFVVIGLLMSAAAGVIGNYFLKPIINDVASFVGQESPDLTNFVSNLLLMGLVFLLGAIGSFGYQRLMLNISTGVLRQVRIDLFTHMQDLPMRYYDTHTHGELMSRYTTDTDTLREMISNAIPQFISSGIQILGVFTMMIVLSWQLTLLVLVMLAVMMLAVKTVGGRSATYFIAQQEQIGKVNGFIEEHIEGQKVVKVFNHESATKADFDRQNEQLYEVQKQAHTFANILMPIMGNLSNIHYALTAGLGVLLIIWGALDVGSVVSFLTYTRSFSQPITQISQQINSILAALAGAERIFDLIDEPAEVDDGYVTLVNAKLDAQGNVHESAERTGHWAWRHPHSADGSVTYTLQQGDVRLEDVYFEYEPGKPVLNGISFYAKPGQKIALVGSTGAGKTTITNLLTRFYDVPDGKIRFDGINIGKIKKDDLRRSIAMVLQDTHLFTGTVMDNIRYGKLDASDAECIQAAKIANADFFISHLPEGYQTKLTADGTNLSQGQRQLLAIARAAVADPPVLILDEATSSIDTRTELLIERGMNKLMEGRTVFVIAHRLSTVRNADAIMVMEHGEIIERGTHDELIADRGRYYQLYTGAFELE